MEAKLRALDLRVFRIVGGDSMDGIKSERIVSMAQFIGDNYPTATAPKQWRKKNSFWFIASAE